MDPLLGILAIIGLATGSLTGLTGASGMSILISMLLLAGIDIRQVIGLTFVVTLANSAVATRAYWRHGHVDWKCGLAVALPAIIAVPIAHHYSQDVDGGHLRLVMTVGLLLIGVKFLRSAATPHLDAGDELAKDEHARDEALDTATPPRPFAGLVVLGVAAGAVMGVMGGGGAVFIGIALMLLFRMETKTAIGTSILIMGLAAIPGVLAHGIRGDVHVGHATAILLTSVPAAIVASRFANRISKRRIEWLLGAYLVLVAVVLAVRQFMPPGAA